MVLPRVEHGSFALKRGVARSAHRGSGIARYFLADHIPRRHAHD
jgi:hypothetical protein